MHFNRFTPFLILSPSDVMAAPVQVVCCPLLVGGEKDPARLGKSTGFLSHEFMLTFKGQWERNPAFLTEKESATWEKPGFFYLGNAAGFPPSTGRAAPVVGVRSLAKKTTAFPTCSASTRCFSRLRSQ